MNKTVVIIGIIVLLGIAAFFVYQRTVPKNVYQQQGSYSTNKENVISSTSVPSTMNSANGTSNSKSQLDAELEKELNQLDQDIKDGSKDSINDSDFNF